jgi:hypothetical protein
VHPFQFLNLLVPPVESLVLAIEIVFLLTEPSLGPLYLVPSLAIFLFGGGSGSLRVGSGFSEQLFLTLLGISDKRLCFFLRSLYAFSQSPGRQRQQPFKGAGNGV